MVSLGSQCQKSFCWEKWETVALRCLQPVSIPFSSKISAACCSNWPMAIKNNQQFRGMCPVSCHLNIYSEKEDDSRWFVYNVQTAMYEKSGWRHNTLFHTIKTFCGKLVCHDSAGSQTHTSEETKAVKDFRFLLTFVRQPIFSCWFWDALTDKLLLNQIFHIYQLRKLHLETCETVEEGE